MLNVKLHQIYTNINMKTRSLIFLKRKNTFSLFCTCLKYTYMYTHAQDLKTYVH